jgi:phage gp46-like protein
MPDIATLWDAGGIRGNWSIVNGSLVGNQDLVTAVVLSVFTDAEAPADAKIPDGTIYRRGWYGDDTDDVRMGSLLWLYVRRKVTADLVPAIRRTLIDCLQWMIADGVIASVNVDVQLNAPNFVAAKITLNRKDGSTVSLNFDWAWSQLS